LQELGPTPSPSLDLERAKRAESDAELLGERLEALIVHAEQVALTIAQGVHGRRRIGPGETFWQYRPFDERDNARDVDWRRSARSDALYVRDTEWEAAQSVWLWRDASPSMDFASDRRLSTKGERADLLTIALAALLLRGGERVALLGGENRPASGRGVLTRLASHLLFGADDGRSLPDAINLPRHSQVVLIGDMLADPEELRHRIAAYAARNVRGVMFQILDPAEESLPYRGRIHFKGMEGEGEELLNRVESLRPNYQARLEAHRDALRQIARLTGWTYLIHVTDNPPEHALLSLFEALEHGQQRMRR
jgi:uncharacterized protein (DUF58 family)